MSFVAQHSMFLATPITTHSEARSAMLTPADILREPPFAAVTQHMQIIVSTVDRLRPLFDALRAGDRERVAVICAEITSLEEAADQIKNAVRDDLPRTIKLPVSRRDLLTVVSAQDTISDNALKIVWLLEVREFAIHAELYEPLMVLLEMVTATVRQAHSLSKEIGILAEARFRGPHVEAAMSLVLQVEQQEAECDDQARNVERALFALEDQLSPVDTLLWYQIIELVGSLADASKKQANRVRLLLAR